tara:strand:+ start:43 stop:201 length:159 start_codon:yes stop_codon:yes gene_type:complete
MQSLKKAAEANLADLVPQIIALESKGEGYTAKGRLLWEQARCLKWFIKQLTL